MNNILPLSKKMYSLLISLKNKESREEYKLFIAEGIKICEELLSYKYLIKFVVVQAEHNSQIGQLTKKYLLSKIPVYYTVKRQIERLSDTVTPQGILACVSIPESEFIYSEPFIALDAVSDPGNVGTIIRTADWFGFKQVILGYNCADAYSPKTVRSTMGSIFHCLLLHKPNLNEFFKSISEDYKLYGADINGKILLNKCKPSGKRFGIVFGSESHGISKELSNNINVKFIIEGKGKAESLNVAIAAGLAMQHFTKYI